MDGKREGVSQNFNGVAAMGSQADVRTPRRAGANLIFEKSLAQASIQDRLSAIVIRGITIPAGMVSGP